MAFRLPKREGSGDSSQEHDSSMEMITSPAPAGSILRRRLEFASPDQNEKEEIVLETNNNNNNNSKHNKNQNNIKNVVAMSPPYRKVRALRLFDSPATPKTILQKSSANHLSSAMEKNNNNNNNKNDKNKVQENGVGGCVAAARLFKPLYNRAVNNVRQQPVANVNPFTPDSLMAHNKKRCRIQFGIENSTLNNTFHSYGNYNGMENSPELKEEEFDLFSAPKRLALQDTNISRYQKEFVEITPIGIGEFGMVYKCLNRLDGCIYAIKKSIKPVAGSSYEKRALNEVWAHAVLGKHDNVVRYYSAWAEDNHMLIQNEYCNGGSLQSVLTTRSLKEDELRTLLLHVAEGLRYIHANDLVHMDLKAGNIFITREMLHKYTNKYNGTHDDDEDLDGMKDIYDELSNAECVITYKIGDLGHVTSMQYPNVEEGDCRYLPNEILQEDYSRLDKADIFSLGITIYEAASGGALPKNGPEWHQLRNGDIPNISSLSKDFNELIKQMTHPDPEKRPSSTSIFNHPVLSSLESKTKSQLTQELRIEKQKNEILLKKLREAKKSIKNFENRQRCRALASPKLMTEQRLLRSFTRKNLNGIRDLNKNIVQL